jgi:hypothetical protein
MQHLAQTAFEFKTDAPSPLEVFKARAIAAAKLLANSMLADKPTAIDALWKFAQDNGVIDAIGVDSTQALLAEAFRE